MPWKIWEPPWSNWSNLLLQPGSPLFFGVYILKSAAEDLNSNNLNIVSNYSLRGRLSNYFRLLLFPLECLTLWSQLLPSPDTWVKFLQNNFPLTLSLEPARIPTNFCLLRSLVVLQSLSHVQLCNPMDCSRPGFPVLHYLPKFAQTHVHWVSDTTPSSNPLSPPSPPALNLSQHQGLLQRVGPSRQVTKTLGLWFSISPSNEYSVLISFSTDLFYLLAWDNPKDSQESSPAPQLESINSSVLVPFHCLDSQPVLAPAS